MVSFISVLDRPSRVFGLLACHAKFPWSLFNWSCWCCASCALAWPLDPRLKLKFSSGAKVPRSAFQMVAVWEQLGIQMLIQSLSQSLWQQSHASHSYSTPYPRANTFASFFQTWGTVATCGRRWRKEGKLDPPADQAHSSFAMIKWWCSHMGLPKTISPTCHPS